MKKIAVVVLLLILSSCATKIDHPSAPHDYVSKIQNFEIEPDKGRIHFFIGKFNGDKAQLNEAFEVFINEEKIVTLGNKSEFATIDLSPGVYSLKCQAISAGSGIATSVPIDIEVKQQDLVFLAANFYLKTSNNAYLFGAVGAIAGNNYIYTFARDNTYRKAMPEYKLISLENNPYLEN